MKLFNVLSFALGFVLVANGDAIGQQRSPTFTIVAESAASENDPFSANDAGQDRPPSRPQRDASEPTKNDSPFGPKKDAEAPYELAIDFLTKAQKESRAEGLPAKLEDWVATALESNPQVKQAEAEQQLAEAKLREARLMVVRDVTSMFYDYARLKSGLEFNRQKFDSKQELHKKGLIDDKEIARSIAGLESGQSRMVEFAAKARVLLGVDYRTARLAGRISAVSPGSEKNWELDLTFPVQESQNSPNGRPIVSPYLGVLGGAPGGVANDPKVAEPIANVLERPVAIDFVETPLSDAIAYLQDVIGKEVVLVTSPNLDKDLPVTAHTPAEVPLRQAMTLLADTLGVTFIVRDYGFLVAPYADSVQIQGVKIPSEQAPVDRRGTKPQPYGYPQTPQPQLERPASDAPPNE